MGAIAVLRTYLHFFSCKNHDMRETVAGMLAVGMQVIEVFLSNVVFADSIAKIAAQEQQQYHVPVYTFLLVKIVT